MLKTGLVALFLFALPLSLHAETATTNQNDISIANATQAIMHSTGLYSFFTSGSSEGTFLPDGVGQIIMIFVGILLVYLAIAKKFEPLLLIPIGFGGILANIPIAGIANEGGVLKYIYDFGIIPPGIFPLLIFMGVVFINSQLFMRNDPEIPLHC